MFKIKFTPELLKKMEELEDGCISVEAGPADFLDKYIKMLEKNKGRNDSDNSKE